MKDRNENSHRSFHAPRVSGVRLELPIANLACAGAAPGLAERIERLPGVLSATVNYLLERAVITFEPTVTSPETLVRRLEEDCGVRIDRWISRATRAGLLHGRIVLDAGPEEEEA